MAYIIRYPRYIDGKDLFYNYHCNEFYHGNRFDISKGRFYRRDKENPDKEDGCEPYNYECPYCGELMDEYVIFDLSHPDDHSKTVCCGHCMSMVKLINNIYQENKYDCIHRKDKSEYSEHEKK